MKRILKGSFPLTLMLLVLLLWSCGNQTEEHAHTGESSKYTCPMHPQIVRDEPGTCPICKMDLVAMNNNAAGASAVDSLSLLVKPTNEFIFSSVKTVSPEAAPKNSQITLQGMVNYNTNNQNTVSAKVSGRIERLYVKYNYEAVNKGQKLMDIYSPDLVNAQQEMLFLKRSGDTALLQLAKRKLRLLGSTDAQIEKVLQTGRPDYSVGIYSGYSGYVVEQQNSSNAAMQSNGAGNSTIISSSSSANPGMNSMESSASPGAMNSASPPKFAMAANSPLLLKEGQYISAGQTLFSLVDAGKLWAEFYADPEQLQGFKQGTKITVQSVDIPSLNLNTAVSLVQPYYNQGSSYSLVRALIDNRNKNWKVGQLISISKEGEAVKGNWLPRTAVLQLGNKYVAFVRRNEVFVPVYVNVLNRSGNWVDVGNSLNSDVQVAQNAWFLVDSQSFIKVEKI